MIVVITGANERTEALTYLLALRQCSRVELLNLTPQFEAVKRAYEIGIESGEEWLVILGADEILLPKALGSLVEYAKKNDLFSAYGQILDKLTLNVRYGCPRVYRTKDLKRALKYLKPTVRPEADVCIKMESKGFKQGAVNQITALHDYHQYYSDIYRKAYAKATKQSAMINNVFHRWVKLSETDLDYRIALRGFIDGGRGNPMATDLGVKEKEPLTDYTAILERIEKPNLICGRIDMVI